MSYYDEIMQALTERAHHPGWIEQSRHTARRMQESRSGLWPTAMDDLEKEITRMGLPKKKGLE
jgi:hypothetical protein